MRPYACLSLAYSEIQIPYVLMIIFKTSKSRLSLFNKLLLLISAAAVAASAKSNCAQLQWLISFRLMVSARSLGKDMKTLLSTWMLLYRYRWSKYIHCWRERKLSWISQISRLLWSLELQKFSLKSSDFNLKESKKYLHNSIIPRNSRVQNFTISEEFVQLLSVFVWAGTKKYTRFSSTMQLCLYILCLWRKEDVRWSFFLPLRLSTPPPPQYSMQAIGFVHVSV